MIVFVCTPEMKADAQADRREMARLADEMERAGIQFADKLRYTLAQPYEIEHRADGCVVWRQFVRQ